MTSELHRLGDRVRPLALAAERMLPVPAPLSAAFPGGGLRLGSMLGLTGPGATSLTIALLREASAGGSWVATAGLPALGLAAASELGLDLERLVMVAPPAADRWAAVTAALVDAFAVVLVKPTHRVRPGDARRLEARTRERGAVLMQVGGRADVWPHAPDLRLTVTSTRWTGLNDGHGRLRARRMVVEIEGRREAAQVRRLDLWLPAADGSVALAAPVSPLAHPSDLAPVVPDPARQAG